eukprot:scaffold4884_cov122-Isochrysis_galbana.AAC.4
MTKRRRPRISRSRAVRTPRKVAVRSPSAYSREMRSMRAARAARFLWKRKAQPMAPAAEPAVVRAGSAGSRPGVSARREG